MAKGSLFGTGMPNVITVVETPLSQSYARKAKIAFLAVAGVLGAAVAAVLAVFTSPWLAVLLGVAVGVVCGFTVAVLVRAWPVLRVLWWWSLEIAVLALVLLLPTLLARVTYPWLALTVVLALAVTGGLVVRVRRFVVAWSWCVVVRHRLRLCFAEFIRSPARTRVGCLPLLLWARPTPAGERVWLWLRPGLDLTDLDGRIGQLAVACWASEVRAVRASTRFAALVRVDVARRDPVAGLVPSPLAALIPRRRKADVPVSPGMPPLGLDLADIPEPAPPSRGGRR